MALLPSVLIVGTGALASLFAARFAEADIPITMMGTWLEGIAALKSKGVTLVQRDGSEKSFPVQVVTNSDECNDVMMALVLVKSWQTERAARQLKECLHPQGLALSLQNGLGNRQKLVASLSEERVSFGVTTTGATLLGPGRVRSGGEGTISLASDTRLEQIFERFQHAGFTVESTSEIDALIWGKLAVNAAINPLTAILRVPNGDLLEQPSTRQLMAISAREVEMLASALGIHLPFDDVSVVTRKVAQRTASNVSSMLQDVLRGAPTEVDAINGAVVQVAEEAGISTPVNHTFWLLVKAIVAQKSNL
jgi:2-dehydropantoate 2-reductase